MTLSSLGPGVHLCPDCGGTGRFQAKYGGPDWPSCPSCGGGGTSETAPPVIELLGRALGILSSYSTIEGTELEVCDEIRAAIRSHREVSTRNAREMVTSRMETLRGGLMVSIGNGRMVNPHYVVSADLDHRQYVNGSATFLVIRMADGETIRLEHGAGGINVYDIQTRLQGGVGD